MQGPSKCDGTYFPPTKPVLILDVSFPVWKAVIIIALTYRFAEKIRSDSRTKLSENMKG